MELEDRLEEKWIKETLRKSAAYAFFLAILVILCGGVSEDSARIIGIGLGTILFFATGQNILFLVITYSILSFYGNIFQISLITSIYTQSALDDVSTELANGVLAVAVGTAIFLKFNRLNLKLPLLTIGVIFTLMILISTYLTGAMDTGWAEFNRLVQFLIFFLMLASFITSKKKLVEAILYSFGSFLVLFVLILLQVATEPVKFTSLGKFLMFIPILQGLAEYTKSKGMKGLYKFFIAMAVIGTLMLLIGESRRLVFSLLLIWALYLFQIGFNKRILLLLGLSMLIIFTILPEDFFARTTQTVGYYSQGLKEEGGLQSGATEKSITSSRNILWKLGWDVFLGSPMFGVGPGKSDYEVGEKVPFSEYSVIRIHNLYLEMLADTGIFGFVVFMAYLIVIWKLIAKGIKTARANEDIFMTNLFLAFRSVFVATLFINFYGNAGIFGKFEWFLNAIMAASAVLLYHQGWKNKTRIY